MRPTYTPPPAPIPPVALRQRRAVVPLRGKLAHLAVLALLSVAATAWPGLAQWLGVSAALGVVTEGVLLGGAAWVALPLVADFVTAWHLFGLLGDHRRHADAYGHRYYRLAEDRRDPPVINKPAVAPVDADARSSIAALDTTVRTVLARVETLQQGAVARYDGPSAVAESKRTEEPSDLVTRPMGDSGLAVWYWDGPPHVLVERACAGEAISATQCVPRWMKREEWTDATKRLKAAGVLVSGGVGRPTELAADLLAMRADVAAVHRAVVARLDATKGDGP